VNRNVTPSSFPLKAFFKGEFEKFLWKEKINQYWHEKCLSREIQIRSPSSQKLSGEFRKNLCKTLTQIGCAKNSFVPWIFICPTKFILIKKSLTHPCPNQKTPSDLTIFGFTEI